MRNMPTRKSSRYEDSSSKFIEESDEPVVETVTFRATHFYAVLVVLALAVGILIGYFVWGRTPPTTIVQQPPSDAVGQVVPTATPGRVTVPTAGYPSLGPIDAPITLVEFGDFECPYCKQWEQQTYQPLLAAYPGKIRFVFRDFPLTSIHPDAMPAAEAAQCANEQNAFWAYHDKLFASDTLGDAVYKQFAQDLNLDMTKFNDCLTNHKYAQAIQDDSNLGAALGVNATPYFFINGVPLVGAEPLSMFQQYIDKELAGELP